MKDLDALAADLGGTVSVNLDDLAASLGGTVTAQAPAAPQDSGQSYPSSLLNAAGRGLTRIAADIPGGLGYLTGSESLVETGQKIEAGINEFFPVNPIYEDDFAMKAANAVGQAGSMLVAGGAGGIIGKVAGSVRAGAEVAALGSGFLSGSREGGQTAEAYGLTGLEKAAMITGKGGLEVLTEKLPFGLVSETAAARRLLGDSIESGMARLPGAIATESAEEIAANTGGNALEIALAPAGAQTPGLLEGNLEAGALGAVGGGVFGLVNAATNGQQPAEGKPVESPLPAQPQPPTQANVGGVPFVFDGKQWGRFPNPAIEPGTAAVVPLRESDPAEAAMIAKLEADRKAQQRKQQAAPATPQQTQSPPAVEKPTVVEPATPAPEATPTTTKRARSKPLPDPTGNDIITIIQGERLRIGQPNEGGEWDWYRDLEQAAAASTLKKQSAESAARRGELEDPAALKIWVDENLLSSDGRIDETAAILSSGELGQTFTVDSSSIGPAILDAVRARLTARDQGSASDRDAALEAEQIAKERQQTRDFLAHAAKASGPEMLVDTLAQSVGEGSTVRIGGIDFAVADLDSDTGTLQLVDPTGKFGSQLVEAEERFNIEAIDGKPLAAAGVAAEGDIEAPFSLRRSLPDTGTGDLFEFSSARPQETPAQRNVKALAALASSPMFSRDDLITESKEYSDAERAEIAPLIGAKDARAASIAEALAARYGRQPESASPYGEPAQPRDEQPTRRAPSKEDFEALVDASQSLAGKQARVVHVSRSKGRAAVRYALERHLGYLPPASRVEIVHDINATDGRGNAWKARVHDGKLTLNAAFLENEADVIWNLEHELAHEVYRAADSNPAIRKAWADLQRALDRHPDIAATVQELDYTSAQSLEESLVRLAQKLDSAPADVQSAWQAFVEAVFEFIRNGYAAARDLLSARAADRIAAQAAARIMQAARNAIQKPAGTATRYSLSKPKGRAQPLTAQVKTPQGWRELGSLAIGDLIAGPDGSESLVKGIYPQGRKPVLKITVDGGFSTHATEDHLWKVSANGHEHVFRTWEIAAMMNAGAAVMLPVAA